VAAQENRISSMLYFRGKVDINIRDANGNTALHWAASKGHQTIVNYLVSDAQVQLDFKDK